MACNDRQLSQAQREAGFEQQRTGVVQALRPFGGAPTIENLLDYINRELVPAVRNSRKAVNDVYLQVADNAPSGNPLAYYFSTETANADPTTGRIRLDASPQNTAATIRVSQENARLQDVTPWLDVMSGGPTTPLGTVTLIDAVNPGRFLRFDLNTMTDQGAYWDLGVTFIEGSHDDPFVEDEAVVLGFIPGVSAAGSTVPVGSLSPIATDTFLGNISGGTQAPVAVPLADVDSASIVYDAASHTFRRAAVTGAVAIAVNANTSVFAGILDNGSAENDRTFLNFLSGTGVTASVTDDAANDELEVRFQWNGTTPLIPDGDKGHIVVSSSGATWLWDTTVSITGSQTIAPTGDLTLTVGDALIATTTNDIRLGASSGVNITAGGAAGLADANDVAINAVSGGIALTAGATPRTGVTNDCIAMRADDFLYFETNGTERLRIESDGSWLLASDNGTAGEVFKSTGASSPPEWGDPNRLSSVISPSAISSDQNNYSPTGWATASVVRLITNNATPRAITGALAGTAGDVKFLSNIGADGVNATITLNLESGSSDAANRWAGVPGTTLVVLQTGAIIWYDGTSSRWRIISGF